MTAPGEQPTQVLGDHGEPCGGCGAPLAADQRYCLNCGLRRGEPRVAYREHLGANGAQPREGQPAPGAQGGASGRPQRDYGPLAAVGGIAVLGLMLLVGVLIGKGSGDETPTAAPSVIRVEGGAEGGETTASDGNGKASANASKKASGKSKRGNGNLFAGRGGSTEPAVTASDDDLEALQQQSPEDYQRASARLPDTIATGGEPPPTDNEAPGGGGGAAVIR